MKRFFREPLLHFLLLSILLFAADALLRDRAGDPGVAEIVVSQGRVENLEALFAKTWQRPPTAQELRGLVDNYVLEEALYREGVVLGIDRDDVVIRRRVRQKMEFFVDDIVDIAEPTDADLEVWLADHSQSYARPAHFSFRQVYLNSDRHGAALRTDAKRILAALRRASGASDPRELGDGSLLGYAYADAAADRVVNSFGQTFADQLAALPLGSWSGPIESAFGLHLVLVDAKTEERLPALAEVRDAVARDWRTAQREKASKAFHEDVVSRYRVTIAWPEDRVALQRSLPDETLP